MTAKQKDEIKVASFYAGASDAMEGKSQNPKRYNVPEFAVADYNEGFENY